jgi:hypothetical protein
MTTEEVNDYVQATYSNGAGCLSDARHAGLLLYRVVRAVRIVFADRNDTHDM